jgi:hypothetical protein
MMICDVCNSDDACCVDIADGRKLYLCRECRRAFDACDLLDIVVRGIQWIRSQKVEAQLRPKKKRRKS